MTPSLRSKAVERYSTDRPDVAATLGFFEKLWDLQDTIAAEAPEWEPPAQEDIEKALTSHRIIFAVDAPVIPGDTIRRALRSVADLLAEEGGLPADQSEALRAADFDTAVTDEMLQDLVKNLDTFISALYEGLGGDEGDIPLPTASFVVTTALTPLLQSAATRALKPLDRFDWPRWDSGLCPVCGTPASSSRILDSGDLQGGVRKMSCPLCRAEWEFGRIRCSRCGERSHEKLEYLFDKQDPGHRIHTCKTCHGYLKTSFEKELGFVTDPAVEEVVMLPLDGVAAERGFTPLGDEETPSAN